MECTPAHIEQISLAWMGVALVLVPVQFRISAPYGRHYRRGWGPDLPYRWAWMAMEVVSPLTFAHFFWHGSAEKSGVHWLLGGLWIAHYTNRSLIYPLRAHMEGKKIPLSITLSAVFFNLVNGFLNGYWLGNFAVFPAGYATSFPFLTGLVAFLCGATINLLADNKLISLRRHGSHTYAIPRGGLFEWISCPNHFGEIVEWCGFALMAWNLPAMSFAVWTAANLIPRAYSHHRWYLSHFPDYPKQRKAVIPGLL